VPRSTGTQLGQTAERLPPLREYTRTAAGYARAKNFKAMASIITQAETLRKGLASLAAHSEFNRCVGRADRRIVSRAASMAPPGQHILATSQQRFHHINLFRGNSNIRRFGSKRIPNPSIRPFPHLQQYRLLIYLPLILERLVNSL